LKEELQVSENVLRWLGPRLGFFHDDRVEGWTEVNIERRLGVAAASEHPWCIKSQILRSG
jgi:hypothetical protein